MVGKERRGLWCPRGSGHPSSRGWGLQGRGWGLGTMGGFSLRGEKQPGETRAERIKSQPWARAGSGDEWIPQEHSRPPRTPNQNHRLPHAPAHGHAPHTKLQSQIRTQHLTSPDFQQKPPVPSCGSRPHCSRAAGRIRPRWAPFRPGRRGGRILGQFTGLTPHVHTAVVGTGTVPSCPTLKGCCSVLARSSHHPPAVGETQVMSSTPPQEPSLSLQGKIAPTSRCTPSALPRDAVEQGPCRHPLTLSFRLRATCGCWPRGGLFEGCFPSAGTLGPLVGNGNAAVLPRLPVTPSRPPARAVVTFPSKGRHARASFGSSTYIQISSC